MVADLQNQFADPIELHQMKLENGAQDVERYGPLILDVQQGRYQSSLMHLLLQFALH